ncbi:MAG: heme ABC transporter ATP-binding protein [Arenicella sp.]|nr:heme ABC transporter ATP-binding protein [Arenicella sp.]
MSLLSVNKLCVRPKQAPQPLLTDISLDVNPGEIVCVIGPNGAGKSTLIKSIAGDIAHQSGSILFENIASNPTLRARQLAVLPQFSLLNFPYRVYEVVALGRVPHRSGVQKDDQIIRRCMALMDIADLEQRRYTTLSGGEKQRVQLARVIAQLWSSRNSGSLPRLLLLDEPTTALDLGHQRMLMQTIGQLAEQEIGIVMVLHDVNLAARYADKILALRQGENLAFGTPDMVITQPYMEILFKTPVTIVPHPNHGSPILVSDDG